MSQTLINPNQIHTINQNQEFASQLETGRETEPTRPEQAVRQFEQQPDDQQVAQLEAMYHRQPTVVETNFHAPIQDVLASRHQHMERFAMAQSFQPAGMLGAIRRAITSMRMESIIARRHREIKLKEANIGGQIMSEFDPAAREHSCHVEENNLIIWICNGQTTFIREMEGKLSARIFDVQDEYVPMADHEASAIYNWLAHYRQRVSRLHR